MRYESQKTERGNTGVSYNSQEAADEQARLMDQNNCSDCSDCSDCSRCSRCYRCSRCSRCSECSECSRCSDCSDCSECSDCSDCSRCSRCSECEGILNWEGEAATNLLGLNGLTWPVAISKTHIQIGCQLHTHEQWAEFEDSQIEAMSDEALEFWAKYKETILNLAKVKAL